MENNYYLAPQNISSADFPTVITKVCERIKSIGENIEHSKEKAQNALNAANEAKEKKAVWSIFGKNKKEAIEALQVASIEQADALSCSIDANSELFKNQLEMSQAIKYLFSLGVASIASNRTTVREIEMKLRNASKEELSDLARKELESVVKQLRAQESIYTKLDGHDILFNEHKCIIDEVESKVEGIQQTIDSFKQSCQETLNKTEQLQASIEQLKILISESINGQIELQKKSFYDLKQDYSENFTSLEKDIEKRITEFETQTTKNVIDEVAKATNGFKQRIDELTGKIDYIQNQLNKKLFFDTTFYKVIIGLTAFAALALHFLSAQ